MAVHVVAEPIFMYSRIFSTCMPSTVYKLSLPPSTFILHLASHSGVLYVKSQNSKVMTHSIFVRFEGTNANIAYIHKVMNIILGHNIPLRNRLYLMLLNC